MRSEGFCSFPGTGFDLLIAFHYILVFGYRPDGAHPPRAHVSLIQTHFYFRRIFPLTIFCFAVFTIKYNLDAKIKNNNVSIIV